MSQASKRSLLPSLMAGAALVMACIIYAEVRARSTIETKVSPRAVAEGRIATLPPHRQAMPEKARFSAIVERPLFSTSRRPPSEEIPVASTPAPDFSLFGVVISTGEHFALVRPATGGDPVRVQEGEEIFGWTVGRIESDRILVKRGPTEGELLLDFTAPAPPTGAAMPIAAPPDQQSTGETNGEAGEPVPSAKAEEPVQADQNAAN